MGYRSDVSLMVRTEDLENFKKNNFEQYKLAFLKDIEGNPDELQLGVNFEKYTADLEVGRYGKSGEEEIETEANADLTLITFTDYKWNTWYKDVKAVMEFVETLDDYEMLIDGEDGATEYYGDDVTLCGERQLYSEVVVHIEAKKEDELIQNS